MAKKTDRELTQVRIALRQCLIAHQVTIDEGVSLAGTLLVDVVLGALYTLRNDRAATLDAFNAITHAAADLSVLFRSAALATTPNELAARLSSAVEVAPMVVVGKPH